MGTVRRYGEVAGSYLGRGLEDTARPAACGDEGVRIPGLIYPVCLPNGHWVGLMSGQYLLTPSGTVDLPGFDVLELDDGPQLAIDVQDEPVLEVGGRCHSGTTPSLSTTE